MHQPYRTTNNLGQFQPSPSGPAHIQHGNRDAPSGRGGHIHTGESSRDNPDPPVINGSMQLDDYDFGHPPKKYYSDGVPPRSPLG